MEGLEVFAFERVDADRGGLARGPKLIPVAEGFQFAGLDGGGIVVALLESLRVCWRWSSSLSAWNRGWVSTSRKSAKPSGKSLRGDSG